MLHEQEAVYSAQAEVFPYWGRIFYSIQEVSNYLSNLMDTEWFFNNFGPAPLVTLKEWKDRNQYAGAADIKNFIIYLKTGLVVESVVLHELAHLLCGESDHGQCFVDTQLKLVRQQMGFQAYAEYHHALRSTGVFV